MNGLAAVTTINLVKSYFGLECSVRIVLEEMCEEDNAYTIQICEGDYEIELNPKFFDGASEQEMVEVIAHEMIHVKQHELDGLEMGVKGNFFKGEWYDPDDDYWFQPWELEARGYERAFWSAYLCIQQKK